MAEHMLTVDADGHVLEPRDTWEKYIDPEFRDRAICVVDDEQGDEVMLVDGKPLQALRNGMAGLGGIDFDDPSSVHDRSKRLRYEDGCSLGGYDAAERLRVMDSERIDVALLYPTLGFCWEGMVTEPRLATAYTRAYNRYIVDFCSHDPRRLVPVAHISLIDEVGAVEELIRAREAGCKAVYLSPDLASRANRTLANPAFDKFWATASDLDIPVGFHVILRDEHQNKEFVRLLEKGAGSSLYSFAFLAFEVIGAFTEMLVSGVFDKFPKLRCTVLESGATWIAAWLDRLDHKYEVMRDVTPTAEKPSFYFYRQCLVSADPDETVIAPIIEAIGADYFVWASDYPHIDASYGVVGEIRSRIGTLSQGDQAKVMGLNAARFYGLDVPVLA